MNKKDRQTNKLKNRQINLKIWSKTYDDRCSRYRNLYMTTKKNDHQNFCIYEAINHLNVFILTRTEENKNIQAILIDDSFFFFFFW